MKRFALFALLCPQILFAYIQSDTVSIRGSLSFDQKELLAEFSYTLQNNHNQSVEQWSFIINPNVNILSISQDNQEVKVNFRDENGYRLLTIDLNTPIQSEERSQLDITFSIKTQNRNPRFWLSSDFVFLDARFFWFPLPLHDTELSFHLSLQTPSDFQTILGGEKISESIILKNKLSTWENNLKDISPSLSLIIQKSPSYHQSQLYFYGNEKYIPRNQENFTLFWDYIKKNHADFPLNEIHIVPMSNLTIPGYHQEVDGEFIGNIFLIDEQILQQRPEVLLETMIHESYHSYFPGVVKFDKEDSILIEALIQYLTKETIKKINPNWADYMKQRDFSVFKNLNKNQQQTLWEFIFYSSLFDGIFNYNNIDPFNFVNILSEKYAHTSIDRYDLLDTLSQEFAPLSKRRSRFFQQIFSSKAQLYNSQLKISQSNFSVQISNNNKISDIPITANTIRIRHNFPFMWTGKLIWEQDQEKRELLISIPPSQQWETNIIGNISYAQADSLYNILETKLQDNYFFTNDSPTNIITALMEYTPIENITTLTMSDDHYQTINSWKKQNFELEWDNYKINPNNEIILGAFLKLPNKKNYKYVEFTINNTAKEKTLLNIKQ